MLLVVVLGLGLPGSAQVADPPAKLDRANLDVHDGFEGQELGPLWDRSKFVPGAVQIEGQTVRAGRQALALTVRSGDKFEKGRPHNADSERDEIMEARPLVATQGEAFEYKFSLYFPLNFPIVPTRLVVAQWKQYCPETEVRCSDNSPILAVRYIGGTLSITQDLGGEPVTLYAKTAEFRGRWLDFRVQAFFMPARSGRVKVWLGNQQIVDFHGVTAYANTRESGYPLVNHFYFKMGLYRNLMAEPMMVYIDEYSKRALEPNAF